MARNRLKGKSIVFTVDSEDFTLDATSIVEPTNKEPTTK